jgi:type IV pilus modification protein PilV
MRTLHKQSGVMLIEALIGILIFAIGVLAVVGMQSQALRGAQDARFRTEAAEYANDLMNQIVVRVDRTSDTSTVTSLSAYQHQPSGTNCAYSGSPSSDALVTGFVANVTGTTVGTRKPLPGSTSAMQQVLIVSDPSSDDYNRVTITVCWKGPEDAVPRKYILTSYVN